MNHSITILTPVYNEEEIIEATILKNLEVLKNYDLDFEIVVVNDASQDRSKEIVERVSRSIDIVFINHEHNLGFGGAIRSGINQSSKDFVLCVPADSPLNQETFQTFYNQLGVADVVISYRIKRLGYSWWMKINSYTYHAIISILFNLQFRDYNWIHMYRRSIFTNGKIKIESNGIFMLAEIIIKANSKNLSITEVSVYQKQRISGQASSAKLKTIIHVMKELFSFIWNKRLKNTTI